MNYIITGYGKKKIEGHRTDFVYLINKPYSSQFWLSLRCS